MICLNNDWKFTENFSEAFLNGSDEGCKDVRLPHTVKELPLHYGDDKDYQMISGYRRTFFAEENWKEKRLFLQFDAAGHIATVYINGKEVFTHLGGYTAFRFEIGEYVDYGRDNVICVKLDSTENGKVPPFGYVIDYLTYGGLYRSVWLDVQEKEYIKDVFVFTPKSDTAHIRIDIDGDQRQKKDIRIKDASGTVVYRSETKDDELECKIKGVRTWDVDTPYLYTLEVSLDNGAKREVRFGFRTIRFRADGFYLNGRRLVMRGLDRHQCYPYIGYAAVDSLQREDARILKEELSCNAVRTSHYPQSQAFIDACDELGLLVFTEIPGWQHIGDEAWKDVACKNVEEMVMQYRNHPSIVLWGVRINESQDDDRFYARTNAIAHELDPSRPTSGVRYLLKSSLLEDVYAYNDFSHSGKNAGARRKKEVTTDMNKALLISEANGHMFPTKSFDNWSRRQEHALRHAKVMNAALGSGEHAGVFQWCMFDYATHKDFGSGDRICYHGVMDAFRNPKLAASVYAMQGENEDVLEVSSLMDIGDYPASNIGDIYVFSNADSVKLYKNGVFVKEYKGGAYRALPHSPLRIDDLIGEQLKENEGFDAQKAKDVHDLLQAAKKHGYDKLPLYYKAKLAANMKRYKLSLKDVTDLYGKYVGNWGGSATVWRFDAVKNGKVVKSRTLCPNADLHLEVKTSATVLQEGETYDMAAVRIRVLDGNGNIAPYSMSAIRYEAKGAIELVGPSVSVAEGGMTGTYVRTAGKKGKGLLKIRADGLEDVEIGFSVE
ncbi:MAG: glycoside hydrolase family 2 protein [Erysipelotrichaceae bacterium]|nr:glycoside hydrolase family 2 protein [Erysipelotrichaceae bacterium]